MFNFPKAIALVVKQGLDLDLDIGEMIADLEAEIEGLKATQRDEEEDS